MIIRSSDYLYGFVYGNEFPITTSTSVKIKYLVSSVSAVLIAFNCK
jgi:hypothetical protein